MNDGARVVTDELEFLISQHFDGTLDAAEAARLQQLIAADAAARTLFDQHAKLDAALRASGSQVAMDESWLSAQIADRIDEANAKPLRISSWGWAAPAAMAACLAIGLVVGNILSRDSGKQIEVVATNPAAPTETVPSIVVAPERSVERAPVVTVISIAAPQVQRRNDAVATVTIGSPSNLTPQIVAALFLAHDAQDARVSIRAAGTRAPDMFD